MPARKDCQICVRAQARGRAHRRIEHPESFTLSVDLSGKLDPGINQEKKSCQYMLVGLYTFPVTKTGEPLVEDGEDPGAEFLGEQAEDEIEGEGEDGGHLAESTATGCLDVWHRLVEDSKNAAVKNLTFVETVESRTAAHVLPAIARIYSRLRQLGLPVMRLHSDRAREFTCLPLRRWAQQRDIVVTKTSGDDYKANGRCEAEVGVVKRATRTVLSAGGHNLAWWPLVARHVGERQLRAQLRAVGYPVGELLQFGTRAYALRKWWQHRYEQWRDVRESVIVLGPDACSTLTSTNYFVQAIDSGRYFFTDDVMVPDFEAIAEYAQAHQPGEQPDGQPAVAAVAPRPADDRAIYLPERDEISRPAGLSITPPRRLHGKTSPAMCQRSGMFPSSDVHNLHHLVEEELTQIDGTAEEQAWCFPILSELLVKKVSIEEELHMREEEKEPSEQQAMSHEFLVSAIFHWKVVGTDVTTAFLNARRRDETKLVAMTIPSVFKRLGLATDDDVWLVEMALYGLTTSPRDWGIHRDITLSHLTWCRAADDGGGEIKGHFERTKDDNLWRVVEVDSNGTRWCGLLCVYVDDLLFCGEEETLRQALAAVESQWSCAEAEWASDTKALKFCGIEITVDKEGNGLHLSQRGYETELLDRWPVQGGLNFPNYKINEQDFEAADQIDLQVLREAQALAGALLWLSTKTRPDLSFGVSAMSRLMSLNPQKALEVGKALLSYVKSNPGDLHYCKHFANDGWGERSQLKSQRNHYSIEVFSDIAYAAGTGHRSIQGIAVFFAGSPVAWQSSQQPFTTHSTAESELVSYCESLLIGRATEALLCAIWGVPLDKNNLWRQHGRDWFGQWKHMCLMEDASPPNPCSHSQGGDG
eukprot:s4968_g2.t1